MKVYLDHAATTATDSRVVECMLPYMTETFGNASSLHGFGRSAAAAVDEARATIARIFHAKPQEIYFTSGGTESDNWALRGVANANRKFGKHIISTEVEHPAVKETLKRLEKDGFEVTYLPTDSEGRVSVEEFEQAVREDTILVSVMFANNETGAVQPIREIGRFCKENGIIFHTDAVQAVNIEAIAKVMNRYDLYAHIIGAADSHTGNAERNQLLGQSRAEYITNELVKKYNIDAQRISLYNEGGTNKYKPFIANRNACVILYKNK